MYKFTEDYKTKTYEEIWADISIRLREENPEVISISGNKFHIHEVTNVFVVFSTPTRNRGNHEILTKRNFIDFLKIIRKHRFFNTSSIKNDISLDIYAMRSPLFAILLALKIIHQFK